MSLREHIYYLSLNETEIEVEKITRNNNKQVKEKHIKYLYDHLNQQFLIDYKDTQEALTRRFQQKFTRKQYSHFLYFIFRCIGTPVKLKCFEIFLNYEHPFELKHSQIEQDQCSGINQLAAIFLDSEVLIQQQNHQSIMTVELGPQEVVSSFSKLWAVQYVESLLIFLNTATSFNFDVTDYYESECIIDLLELLMKSITISYLRCLEISYTFFISFFLTPDNEIYKKYLFFIERLITITPKISQLFNNTILNQYFIDLPPIHSLPLEQLFEWVKRRFDYGLYVNGEIKTPIKNVTMEDYYKFIEPLSFQINEEIKFLKPFTLLPTSRVSSEITTPKKGFFISRSNSRTRESSSLSSSPQRSSPLKVVKKERKGLIQSSGIKESSSFNN
ncbi:hypothetical protein EHI8A_012000 [Entamoeba histolytica HM-1:IMSS-B]|uniref:Uncharacterized protein n=6 Tax=Entamoeba histolytica TaxID=5759 RepID=C4M6F6_ENTH1|nr:hypothetical protein EHI_099880 [Entamoeba histolytica HM-1:IMSS]EMD49503.1 Hypothetical protein EHI5A_026750 [Entamoeba histolytica KU27]EMH75152.1 hypothetical protein EHI8A_012000 [Entamoeba histolytica HM-1:IMSS-B]EMS13746.1 hypothetical protein KM1_028490 [Entamoeba histolytica HM-3:IMSS]ENY63023.1 hypothetical protein EHI7A_012280 [Entamoeba histolytica HM-1:IMSS-A]GAT97087.1 hypothetical protein CL6EHI_099880 [Entamoeba histolytica]|eukprot:XP_651286.1 hypothetical protein EHI_099880 [Entamoeba histolytica HM-1:IMSS]